MGRGLTPDYYTPPERGGAPRTSVLLCYIFAMLSAIVILPAFISFFVGGFCVAIATIFMCMSVVFAPRALSGKRLFPDSERALLSVALIFFLVTVFGILYFEMVVRAGPHPF